MDEKLKEALFELMDSHDKLSLAEYQRNQSYNDTHFSHKAEVKMMSYLEENEPDIWQEFLGR